MRRTHGSPDASGPGDGVWRKSHRDGDAGGVTTFDAWNEAERRVTMTRGKWQHGQLTELSGELIDTHQSNIAWFAEELGLTLEAILETRRSGGRQDTCLSMVES